jgi:hypothetical protein
MMYVLLLLSSENKTTKIASNLIWPRIFCSFQYLIGETKARRIPWFRDNNFVRIGVKAVLSIYPMYNVCSSYRILEEIVLVIMCPED